MCCSKKNNRKPRFLQSIGDIMKKNIEFHNNHVFYFEDDLEQRILSPLSCIKEHESKWVLEFDLPLVDKKDISVFVDSGIITVEAKLKETYCDEHRKSCQYEYFKKSLTVPSNVDFDKISAKFVNGRLTVVLPKVTRGTKIKIED